MPEITLRNVTQQMNSQYTKAKFWKCALQVNPASYSSEYRGKDHGMNEEEYNHELVRLANSNDVKIIGLANHGNVDGMEAIKKIMNEHGIIVFPDFEIASSEKAHFVCLFKEETTRDELVGYIGKMELEPNNPTRPSKLSAEQIINKIIDLEGFIYAAHCTDDNGVLSLKLNHVWMSPNLKAAQIPGSLEDLNRNNEYSYYQILQNKTPEYKRQSNIAIINAKDVERPQTLSDPKASCLIKMTRPCFESFKLAFHDPESRVRLNSDVAEKHYSCIESLKVTGGYLDGIQIE